ncbi:hypothetical protein HDU98_009294 [Podochytrium sp. JEL0797]|nr:hypothetical protein HDU98_009294 [Podochytrium sp. JEL0797]
MKSATVAAFAAIGLRLALLLWGVLQDQYSSVKYTDIDYFVFSDAAALVARGHSPYLRATFRYTPLLAFLVSAVNGKLLFCACDLAAAWCIFRLNRLEKNNNTNLELALWALNPFVAVISTRGNAESLIAALVLATVFCLVSRKVVPAAVLFGLAVHLKVYAVIYALPFWLFIDHDKSTLKPSSPSKTATRSSDRLAKKKPSEPPQPQSAESSILANIIAFFSFDRILFGVISASVFFLLGGLFYYMYGHEFLEHTYLYHITRQDHRHNFSIYFYHLYLSSTGETPSDGLVSKLSGLMAFLPQLGVSSFVGAVAAIRGDIVFALFAQTFVFVMLNKVVTSQYFMWYLCFLPVVLQRSRLVCGTPQERRRGWMLVVLWVFGQAVWLLNAYRLEHLGHNTFRALHFAGMLFEIINAYILVQLTLAHQLPPIRTDSRVSVQKKKE